MAYLLRSIQQRCRQLGADSVELLENQFGVCRNRCTPGTCREGLIKTTKPLGTVFFFPDSEYGAETMKKAAGISQTAVPFHQPTRRHIPRFIIFYCHSPHGATEIISLRSTHRLSSYQRRSAFAVREAVNCCTYIM